MRTYYRQILLVLCALLPLFTCCIAAQATLNPQRTIVMPALNVTVEAGDAGPDQLFTPYFPSYLLQPPQVTVASTPAPVPLEGYYDSTGKHTIAHLLFNQNVSDDSVSSALAFIEIVKKSKAEVLVLELNTLGGLTQEGFKLEKALESLGIPSVCVVDGNAMSEGFSILQTCTLRLMTNRSLLMIHEPLLITQELNYRMTREQLQHDAQVQDTLAHAWMNHAAARMSVSLEQVRQRVFMKDWQMDEREAQQFQAVDAVVKSVKSVLETLKQSLSVAGHQL